MSDAPRAPSRLRKLAAAAIVLAVCASSALVFSARLWWLGDLAASFEWHLGWLTLVASIALGALRAFKLAAVTAVLAALHLAPDATLWWPRDVDAGGRASLRIVAANLLQPNDRYEDVAAALRACGADVIAVEELSLRMRNVLERELASWPHRAFSPEPKSAWNGGTWGLGVFSRSPLLGVRRVQLGVTYAPSIEVVLAFAGRDVVLRAIHVPRPGTPWHMQRRNGALDDLTANYEWTSSCIALGDFNITSTNPGFARLLERTHLRDSRAGFGRQPSWTMRKAGVALSIAIDHALVGGDFDVLERHTFEIPGSDHRGVCVELALR